MPPKSEEEKDWRKNKISCNPYSPPNPRGTARCAEGKRRQPSSRRYHSAMRTSPTAVLRVTAVAGGVRTRVGAHLLSSRFEKRREYFASRKERSLEASWRLYGSRGHSKPHIHRIFWAVALTQGAWAAPVALTLRETVGSTQSRRTPVTPQECPFRSRVATRDRFS